MSGGQQLLQKFLEWAPGGAVGGLVGGIIGFLYWNDRTSAACDVDRYSVTDCADAITMRNWGIPLFSALGAVAGVLGVGGYRVHRRTQQGESITSAIITDEQPGS
jgi:hypothetical protein